MRALLRYLGVGGSMALLYAAIVALVHSTGASGLTGAVVASCCVLPVGFTLQRKITFRSIEPLIPQALGYLAVSLATVPIGAMIVFMLVDALRQNTFVSGLAATAGASMLNFFALRRVVFHDDEITL